MTSFAACKRCHLSAHRRNVVMGRGKIPADILFIGEAPGKVEDIRGEAFVGPSGKLLNILIKEAWELAALDHLSFPAYYITNTIGCRPCDRLGGENREPTEEEILACQPRLEHVVRLVKPKVIIFIGKFSKRYYGKRFAEHFDIYHPAYLLRGGGRAHPEYISTIRKLSEAFTYYKKEVLDAVEKN